MIKHHPKTELLNAYVVGELPASLSAAIAIHSELCPICSETISNMTEQCAEQSFEPQLQNDRPAVDEPCFTELDFAELDIDQMINNITADTAVAPKTKAVPKQSISVKGQTYTLPRALNHIQLGKWAGIGKLTRSRLDLNEGETHTSLLQIKPGGQVPQHTHKGFELTLLLDGSFEDELGGYEKGDFIMLDSEHVHTPTTKSGCLCYTVSNDALHFTQGINKLLNPIGSLIY